LSTKHLLITGIRLENKMKITGVENLYRDCHQFDVSYFQRKNGIGQPYLIARRMNEKIDIPVSSKFSFQLNLLCKKKNFYCKDRLKTQFFRLRHYVQNCLSYLGKETGLTLCLKGCRARLGIISRGTNKDQLLHRIQSAWTFTNLHYF